MAELPIPFNLPHVSGNELKYIEEAIASKKISGNGAFTQKCQGVLSDSFGFRKVLLTSSCTDALEMAAILADIKPGDEVIMPSYTFVSTANAFILRGAKIRFVDSRSDHPGMDEELVEALVTDRTKAIVPVHYAGVASDMDALLSVSEKHGIRIIEDAAQALDSYYKGRSLGSIGDMGAFSFHETKNIISGEGGCLVVSDSKLDDRSEIIWEKGTNRSAFWKGEVDKYGWVDIGSSFLPSELTAAFLYGQLENIASIQKKRLEIWNRYDERLRDLQDLGIQMPAIPEYATNNAHMYYMVVRTEQERNDLIDHLKRFGVNAVFHYLGLYKSEYFKDQHDGRALTECDRYTRGLLRLPLHVGLSDSDLDRVCRAVRSFYNLSF
ncbi:MAG: dTDP-4-amino-4,6-dideoxygalactose transaminase [Flavobacteriales bacterium]|nr:dTDP-4-amino-4,6-dideoxygalactose transaminase [Flavobacteriales bacterium]